MAMRLELAILAVVAGLTGSATARPLLVLHGWSSPAEIAALNVLKAQVEKQGNTWVNLAIPHDNGTHANVLTLIASGNSPNVFMEPNPQIYRTLRNEGLALSPEDLFRQSGALQHFPPAVMQAISVDGRVMKVPNTIHADGVIYFNRAVAAASGVDPDSWTSLDDMFADFAKVRAAGYLPLALSGQQWQVGYLTHALVAAIGGSGLYTELYGTKPDAVAFDDPALLQVFATLRKFQQAADPDATDRNWNAATSMVISGKALMQLQGDWMKGEWHAAGKTLADFGCLDIPGAKALALSIDGWGLLGGASPEATKAELDFAAAVVDPAVQSAFAAAKGSTPVRLDVPESALDECSNRVIHDLDRPDFAVVTPNLTATQTWLDTVWAIAFDFWNAPGQTPQQAVDRLRQGLVAEVALKP